MTSYHLATTFQALLALLAFAAMLRSEESMGRAVFFCALGLDQMWWCLARLTFAEVEPVYHWVSLASGMDGKLFFERSGFVAILKGGMLAGLAMHFWQQRSMH